MGRWHADVCRHISMPGRCCIGPFDSLWIPFTAAPAMNWKPSSTRKITPRAGPQSTRHHWPEHVPVLQLPPPRTSVAERRRGHTPVPQLAHVQNPRHRHLKLEPPPSSTHAPAHARFANITDTFLDRAPTTFYEANCRLNEKLVYMNIPHTTSRLGTPAEVSPQVLAAQSKYHTRVFDTYFNQGTRGRKGKGVQGGKSKRRK